MSLTYVFQQDDLVLEGGGAAQAVVPDPARQQHQDADEAQAAHDAARHHGEQLFGAVRHAEAVEREVQRAVLVARRVVDADVLMLPLARNARAKMLGITDGFVKLFAQKGSGAVVGGVVVAPRASELIFPVTLAVQHRLNVDQVASTFTVYPSLAGSISEAARRLHVHL